MLIRYCLCSIKFSSIDVIYKKKKKNFNNSKDFLSDSADRKSQAHSYLRVFNQVVDVTSSFVCGLCDCARYFSEIVEIGYIACDAILFVDNFRRKSLNFYLSFLRNNVPTDWSPLFDHQNTAVAHDTYNVQKISFQLPVKVISL